MELLRDKWLGRTIEQELGDVLERWGKSGAAGSPRRGDGENLTFEDDGSNLRIKSARLRVAQIIKFITHHEPLQAVVSDSATRVNATISKDAARRYTEKTRKRLTDGTLGGLIQLLDFEIVATHIGTRANRITLFVTDFKPLGANGSGMYGVPQAVEDRSGIRELIEKLKYCREGFAGNGTHSNPQTPSKASPILSQLSGSPPDFGFRDTQATFATQAPPSKIHTKLDTKPKHSSAINGFDQQVGNGSVEVSATPGLRHAEAEDQGVVGKQTGSLPLFHAQNSAFQKPKISGTAQGDLLGLLHQAQNFRSAQAAAPAVKPSTVSTRKLPTPPVTAAIEQSRPIFDTRMVTGNPESSSSPKPTFSESPPKGKSDNQSGEIEAVKSQYSKKTQNRISRRDVTIPKDQDALLNRTDSWLPAEPGQREPSANIPISILKTLNQRANALAKRAASPEREDQILLSRSDGDAHSQTSLNKDSGSQPETESDAPVSASEWPPSPRTAHLPPDSSTESADLHSNDKVQLPKSPSVPIRSQSLHTQRLSQEQTPQSSRKNCPMPTCKMSFNTAGALRYHQNHYHNGSESANASESGLDDRDESYPSPSRVQYHVQDQHDDNSVMDELRVRTPKAGSLASTPESVPPSSGKAKTGSLSREIHDDSHQSLIESHASHASPALQSEGQNLKSFGLLEQGPEKATLNHVSFPNQDSSASVQASLQSNGFRRRRRASSLYSIPPSPGSDLETNIPLPLTGSAHVNMFPSTAYQPMEPFAQVKRTPYVNGQASRYSPPKIRRQHSASNFDCLQMEPNGTQLEDVDHVTQSAPSVMETSSSEALMIRLNEEHIAANHPQIQSHQESDAMRTQSGREDVTTESSGQMPEDAIEPIIIDSSSPSSDTEERDPHAVDAHTTQHPHHERNTKRRTSDMNMLSPNVVKRRKRFKAPVTFDFTESEKERPDPSEGAKRYRQDFIASRRSSEDISLLKSRRESKTPLSRVETDADGADRKKSSDQKAIVHPSQVPSGFDQFQPTDANLEQETLLAESSKFATRFDRGQDHGKISSASEVIDSDLEGDNSNARAQESETMDFEPAELDQASIELESPNINRAKPTPLPGERVTRLSSSQTDDHGADINASQISVQNSKDMAAFVMEGGQSPRRIDAQNNLDELEAHKIKDGRRTPQRDEYPSDSAEPRSSKSISSRSVTTYDPTRRYPAHLPGGVTAPKMPVMNEDIKDVEVVSSPRYMDINSVQNPPIIFDRFKASYPSYSGDQPHFIAICKKISNLLDSNRMEHQALWDDFIVRHKVEYPQYLRRCAEDADDPLRYEEYYQTEIEQPLHQAHIVTRKTLKEVLSLEHRQILEAAVHEVVGPRDASDSPELLTESARVRPLEQKSPKVPVTGDLVQSENRGSASSRDLPNAGSAFASTKGQKRADAQATHRSLPWLRAEGKGMTDKDSMVGKGHSGSGRKVGTSRQGQKASIARNPDLDKTRLPSPPIATNHEPRQKNEAGAWWTDENTPFRAFATAYASIRNGNGNSYAQGKSLKSHHRGSRTKKNIAPADRVIDPLSWEL